MKARIGILGGMGPYPGLDIARKVMDHTLAASDQEHLPLMVYSFPHRIPDRTEYLEGRESRNPAYPMAEILAEMEQAGIHWAGVPCNSSHAPRIWEVLLEELEKRNVGIRLLNLIEETVNSPLLKQPDIQKVAVMSTTGTWRAGMYARALEAAGLEAVVPDTAWQERIHRAIYDPEWGVKAEAHPVNERAAQSFLDAMGYFCDRGAQSVILGCTEIGLFFREPIYESMQLVDPATELARALIREAAPEKLRPLSIHSAGLT